ncbi:MAG: alpha/beta fold hydrolase [Dehalococcoidia bacterium]|nr:alpha/beta fold hydrolase [Dehalococcoidia bacterium]
MTPSIRYATTQDGVSIALATLGEGVPLLCLPPLPFSHIEAGWRLEGQRAWYEGLARRLQVALYDVRGTGLSDRARAEFDLEAMLRDVEAVVARLGWERFAVCGLFNSAPVAIAYAARHPEAVSDLLLWGGFARGADVYLMPMPANAEASLEGAWLVLLNSAAHLWSDGARDAAPLGEFFRAAVEPAAAFAAFSAAREYDVSALLPRVAARTLVLHRPHARGQRADLGPALAAAIPGAELALLEGEAPSPFAGDVSASVAAIEAFLEVAAAPRDGGGGLVAGEGRLTPREAEVLRLLARGMANKEIAGALDVSVHTVERHLTNLYPKIGCRSRTEATAYAITRGFA